MTYTPSYELLKKYADVLVKRALWSGQWINKGDVVLCQVPECARPMLEPLQIAILEAGGHPLMRLLPDGLDKTFFAHASDEQISFYPEALLNGQIEQITHSIRILADYDMHAMRDVPAEKLMLKQSSMWPWKKAFFGKENAWKLTRTLALYGTPAMAAEVNMSLEEYRQQIIQACYLDSQDPIAERKRCFDVIEWAKNKLNELSIERVHMKGADCDLKVKLGTDRKRLGGSGRNVPSFEVFISPDRRGTEWRIRFNQPMYRYWTLVEGMQLRFENGLITKATAEKNEEFLLKMIAQKNADKIWEYSLTDKRTSRITKFMAEILYDENMWGEFGNSHIAVGSAYKDSFTGDMAAVTPEQREEMGFNDSVEHTDLITTTDRTVTAYMTDGTSKVIYENGMFTL